MATVTGVELGETTTKSMAAKALGCSEKTITRMIARGELEDGGTDAEGRRLVTMSSLVAAQTGRRAVPEAVEPTVQTMDPGMTFALETLREQLAAERLRSDRMLGQMQITAQSVGTMQEERDKARLELAEASRKAELATRELRRLSEGGGFWSRRKRAALAVAKLEEGGA